MNLIEAIKENNEKEFFELLSLKANPVGKKIIDEVDTESGGSVLYWAAACGRLDFIAPLLKVGADANKADKHGWTPTYIAAYYGRAEIITALKAGGADANTPNDSGTTPVCAAAYTGGAKAITALKAAGANVNTPEINGLTPIYIAVQMRDVKVISALLEAGANVNTKTPHGIPLELAKQGTTQRDRDIVRLLEAHLQQYPNGIKILAANSESTQLNQELSQEDFVAQAPQYDNPDVEAKAGRDVVTITGGVRGLEITIGGGNSSFTEASQSNSDSNPKESARVDNIAVFKKLRSFFMRGEYKGSESPDCELYNRVLATYKYVNQASAGLIALAEDQSLRGHIRGHLNQVQAASAALVQCPSSLTFLYSNLASILPQPIIGLIQEYYTAPKEVTEFLKLVAEGEQDQAEVMLKRNPDLALASSDVTDLSGRLFDNITGFQYAVWALDWHMWTMIRKYLPDEDARLQAQGFETGAWVKSHGEDAKWILDKLLEAYETTIGLYQALKHKEGDVAWVQQVGRAQLILPAHVINEYCHPTRSFYPIPNFKDTVALPRTRNRPTVKKELLTAECVVHDGELGGDKLAEEEWLTRGGKLGETFAWLRTAFTSFPAATTNLCNWCTVLAKWYGAVVRDDRDSIRALSSTRIAQREELIAELIPKNVQRRER